jgi:hypothetical protein
MDAFSSHSRKSYGLKTTRSRPIEIRGERWAVHLITEILSHSFVNPSMSRRESVRAGPRVIDG